MITKKTFTLTLSGGAIYDSLKSPPASVLPAGAAVPAQYRRLNFWAASGAMNVQTGSGPPHAYPAGSAYDTGFTGEPQAEEISVNGTGTLNVEYWT